MKLLDKLNRRYSNFGIKNLMLYIVVINTIIFILDYLGGHVSSKLLLYPPLVYQGEIWRLFTFVLIPPATHVIFFAFVMYFYYMIGQTLEYEWGVFKFNVYFFSGMIIMAVSSLLFNSIAVATYLNASLFLAFATLNPNYEIRLYLIIPIKIKYLAYITVGIYVFQFLTGGNSIRISIIAGIANYLLFFGKELIVSRGNSVKNKVRKEKYVKASQSSKEYRHKCSVCGKTEKDDPQLEFRFCSKCDGYHEYCLEHLTTHEHIKENN